MTDTDTIKMLYDGYDCVADYNDADNLLRHYITPGLDENVLVYDVDNAEEYFYLHDGLGTVRQIINDTQTIESEA